MVSNIPFGFTNRNERATSKRTSQFSFGISEKLPYHLPSIRNFQNFLSNGKHPLNLLTDHFPVVGLVS